MTVLVCNCWDSKIKAWVVIWQIWIKQISPCKNALFFRKLIFIFSIHSEAGNKNFHTVLFFLSFPNKENKCIFQDCVGTLVLCTATIRPVISALLYFFFFYALVLLLSFFLRRASSLELLSNVLTRQYCVRWSLFWCPGLCTAQPLERSLLRIWAMQAAGTSPSEPSMDSAGARSWTNQSKQGTVSNPSNELWTLRVWPETLNVFAYSSRPTTSVCFRPARLTGPQPQEHYFFLSLFLFVCCTDYWWKNQPNYFFLLIIKYCNIFNIK